jgi:hypothetical protein
MNAMQNPQAPHLDFGFMSGWIAESPKAMPSNLDMVMERNGNLLIAEWKRVGEKVSMGQQILLTNMAACANVCSFVINGHTDGGVPVVGSIFQIHPDAPHCRLVATGIDGLKSIMCRWHKMASGIKIV